MNERRRTLSLLVSWPLLLLALAGPTTAGHPPSAAHGQPLSGTVVVYGTVIERDSGSDVRVSNAVLSFLGSNGATIKVRTDEKGEYSVELPSEERYSLTVTSRELCAAHRPPFDTQSGRKVKFDIVLTTACPKDLVVSGEDSASSSVEFCANAGVYYCEQQVTIDAKSPVTIMIGFTSRKIEDGRILYSSSIKSPTVAQRWPGTSGRRSVSVAFGTYTIRAESVTLDLQKRTLSARGNVSITHDDQEISVGSPCMDIRFSDQEPAVVTCSP